MESLLPGNIHLGKHTAQSTPDRLEVRQRSRFFAFGVALYQALGFVDLEDSAAYHLPERVIAPPPPASVAPASDRSVPVGKAQ